MSDGFTEAMNGTYFSKKKKMRTKEEIIEELVNKGIITFREALILMEKEKEYIPYYPQTTFPTFPTYPSPFDPQVWYTNNTGDNK